MQFQMTLSAELCKIVGKQLSNLATQWLKEPALPLDEVYCTLSTTIPI